jgi:hypothetical protein
MATPSTAKTKDLIVLAERMGIPVDEAMRQLAQRIADVEPAVSEAERAAAPESQVPGATSSAAIA